LTPLKGPCAGGTHVTIKGEYLNYGSDMSVRIFNKTVQILR